MATATGIAGAAVNHHRRPTCPSLAARPLSSSYAAFPHPIPSFRIFRSLAFQSGNPSSERRPKSKVRSWLFCDACFLIFRHFPLLLMLLSAVAGQGLGVVYAAKEPLKVIISGAPASGKGTQCEMIVEKVGFTYSSYLFSQLFFVYLRTFYEGEPFKLEEKLILFS